LKHIILAVTNDLFTDQRVHRVAQSLVKAGCRVTLVGRVLPASQAIPQRSYSTHRFKMLFHKGILFYGSYNLRLLFYLFFQKTQAIVANDLDSLPACFITAKLKQIPLIYDSHEYFTEVPELINRKFVRSFWLRLENFILPRIKYSYTVNSSLARIYSQKYKISMEVIRNLPFKESAFITSNPPLNFGDKKILLYQGSLNIGRGLEMAIDAMQYIESAILVIIGDGDISHQLRHRVADLQLQSKVRFTGRIPFEALHSYTASATLGLSVEENLGENYYYSLPNKLFDYIQAQLPVIASNFPETAAIINEFQVGCTFEDRNPVAFAKLINSILADSARYNLWKSNLKKASTALCWENEEPILLSIFVKAGILNP